MDQPSLTPKPTPESVTDDDRTLLINVAIRFMNWFKPDSTAQLFRTDAPDLWPMFLGALPTPELRRTYTCTACRRFVERYGNLALIFPNGVLTSALWHEDVTPEPFKLAVHNLRVTVEDNAAVTDVFYDDAKVWGTPITGPWEHFAVDRPRTQKHSVSLTASQAMALKHEEYRMLSQSCAEYSLETIRTALNLLKGDALYRSEKVLGVAEWFYDLKGQRADTHNTRRRNHLTWRAVASAPPGYAHIRSSMIGTLLDDIETGGNLDGIARRFRDKMSPLQYQRPTAAPAAGQIARAEQLVNALGITASLKRRFARLEEINALWVPTAAWVDEASTGGVFSHLRPKGPAEAPAIDAPETTFTWTKFAKALLPETTAIEYWVPKAAGNYLAITTAVDPEAPPILQWDSHVRRNPAAWYVYSSGSMPKQWGLTAGAWVPVTTICLIPSQWDLAEPVPHWTEGVVLLLQGARDLEYTKGAIFFPEALRSELHEIRSTLEAYSKDGSLAGKDEATACGLDLRKGQSNWACRIRVTTPLGRTLVKLDRWD